MSSEFDSRKIVRFKKDGCIIEKVDKVVCEQPISIFVNGECKMQTIITPSFINEWVVGALLTLEEINNYSDIETIIIEDNRAEVKKKTNITDLSNKDKKQHLIPLQTKFSFDTVMSGTEWLATSPIFYETGGVHTAAFIKSNGSRICRFEDIGRRGAVEKAIGFMAINNINVSDCALIVSCRVPLDIAKKAAVFNVPLLASVSAPTAEAVDFSHKCQMTLIGFARGERMNIYSVPQRLFNN